MANPNAAVLMQNAPQSLNLCVELMERLTIMIVLWRYYHAMKTRLSLWTMMESVKRTLKTVSIKLTFKVDELFRDVFFHTCRNLSCVCMVRAVNLGLFYLDSIFISLGLQYTCSCICLETLMSI